MKAKPAQSAAPVVRAPAMHLSLTRPQIKRLDGVIEVSRKLIAEQGSALIAVVGQVIYNDKKSGETAVRLIFRAVPHEKFLQISEILEDC